MKKSYDNYLHNTASSLPVVYTLQKTVKQGSELLADNPEAKDENGLPIEPHKKYSMMLPVPVNHEVKLRHIWKNTMERNRQQKIQDYVDSVYVLHQAQQQSAQQKIEEEIQSV